MRHDDLYMLIDCVPADQKSPSGHKHNSRLSFELFAGDKSFIIDPGSYLYTADKEMISIQWSWTTRSRTGSRRINSSR
jgi:hypothetical protein